MGNYAKLEWTNNIDIGHFPRWKKNLNMQPGLRVHKNQQPTQCSDIISNYNLHRPTYTYLYM